MDSKDLRKPSEIKVLECEQCHKQKQELHLPVQSYKPDIALLKQTFLQPLINFKVLPTASLGLLAVLPTYIERDRSDNHTLTVISACIFLSHENKTDDVNLRFKNPQYNRFLPESWKI